jgi:hypothetical protein
MTEYLVVVDVDGTIYGMWSDDLIGLYEIEQGRVDVQRASHVEYCGVCQGWEVYEAECLGSQPTHLDRMTMLVFSTRQEALLWEQEEVNRRLIQEL